jgi:hypothetical protein
VYCFFLQVRHKFELRFLEVSAKNKPLCVFQILMVAEYKFFSYRSYQSLWELWEHQEQVSIFC